MKTNGNNTVTLAACMVLMTAIPAWAAPKLVVRINDVTQQNHAEYQFPNTKIGEFNQQIIILRNESGENLFFSENPPVILFSDFDAFEIVQPPLEAGNKLSPNGSTAFLVRFKPTLLTQTIFAHVYIWTNDPATPFHLILKGTPVGPKMVVRHNGAVIPDLGSITFPDTHVGESSEITLIIKNEGNGTLKLNGNPTAQLFGGFDFEFEIVEQPETELAPGQSTDMTIAFNPTLVYPSSTRLFIDTNENDQFLNGIYDIDVKAKGLAPLPDCNGNGVSDAQDIANGTSEDCNGNGVPDECEADSDDDGVIDDCDPFPNGEDEIEAEDGDEAAEDGDEEAGDEEVADELDGEGHDGFDDGYETDVEDVEGVEDADEGYEAGNDDAEDADDGYDATDDGYDAGQNEVEDDGYDADLDDTETLDGGEQDEDDADETNEVVTPSRGPCGMGGGMAMMMCLLCLCGGRRTLRRSVR